jgi:hypothetical protein
VSAASFNRRREPRDLALLRQLGLNYQRAQACKLVVVGTAPACVTTMAGTHTACGTPIDPTWSRKFFSMLLDRELYRLAWCPACRGATKKNAGEPMRLVESWRRAS